MYMMANYLRNKGVNNARRVLSSVTDKRRQVGQV